MKDKILKAMQNAYEQNTLNNLDTAAELLYIEDIISRDDYEEIHQFYRTHWYSETSGRVIVCSDEELPGAITLHD